MLDQECSSKEHRGLQWLVDALRSWDPTGQKVDQKMTAFIPKVILIPVGCLIFPTDKNPAGKRYWQTSPVTKNQIETDMGNGKGSKAGHQYGS